jgi:hypothetical protein
LRAEKPLSLCPGESILSACCLFSGVIALCERRKKQLTLAGDLLQYSRAEQSPLGSGEKQTVFSPTGSEMRINPALKRLRMWKKEPHEYID